MKLNKEYFLLGMAVFSLNAGMAYAGGEDAYDVSSSNPTDLSCSNSVLGWMAPFGNEGGMPHYFKIKAGSIKLGSETLYTMGSMTIPMSCSTQNGLSLESEWKATVAAAVAATCQTAQDNFNLKMKDPNAWVGGCPAFGEDIANQFESFIVLQMPRTPQSFDVNWEPRSGFWFGFDNFFKQAWGDVHWVETANTPENTSSVNTTEYFGINYLDPNSAVAARAGIKSTSFGPFNLCTNYTEKGKAIAFYNSSNWINGFSEVMNQFVCKVPVPNTVVELFIDVEARSEWQGFR